MALDRLTLLDETIINNTATSVATTVVNNSAQTNYISYPVAVGNPLSNGWRVYSDGASTSPVDGTGGSPNTTLTQNTSSPLNSTGDFRITKTTGASRQGEGISTDFTIANRHLAKVLQISFDYEVPTGSTLANDDLRVYIIANPSVTINPGVTNIVIEPVNVSIQGVLTGTRVRHIATFQTDFTITTYRLCIHIATTTSSTQIVDFNNFRVWETTQSVGAIITDWQSYTPTFTQQNGTALSNISALGQWRRVGGSVEIKIKGSISGSLGTYTDIFFSLPSGITGTSLNTNIEFLGNGVFTFGVNTQLMRVDNFVLTSFSRLRLTFQLNSGTIAFGQFTNVSYTGTNGDTFIVNASVPVAGWGSSVAMSSDSNEGRVVACLYTNAVSATIDSNNGIRFSSASIDTHNSYNTLTGEFTAPIEGIYSFLLSSIRTVSGGWRELFAYVGNNQRFSIGAIQDGATTLYFPSAGSIYLRAGERLSFRTTVSGTVTAYTNSSLNIFRISAGSQQIASSESVGLEVWTSTTSTSNSTTNFLFNQVSRDTHGAWNTSTGVFTPPMSGWYNYNLMINPNGHPGASGTLDLYKNVNGTFTKYKMIAYVLNTTSYPNANGSLYLLAGEQISFRSSISYTAASNSTLGANSSWLTINRIGI